MILDTSAVVAIIMKESGHEGLLQEMASDGNIAIGAATLSETAIVLSARLQRDARPLLARFLSEASITVVPFGESHYGAAVDAWLRYGKGRHPAALNFGDCHPINALITWTPRAGRPLAPRRAALLGEGCRWRPGLPRRGGPINALITY